MPRSSGVPSREATPSGSTPRPNPGPHQVAVPSRLNPANDTPTRAVREKKESLKKRESKADPSASGVTPDLGPINKAEGDGPHPQRLLLSPPKSSDFKEPTPAVLKYERTVKLYDGQDIDFYSVIDFPQNKKGFKYIQCVADPGFPNMLFYRRTETTPYGPRMEHQDKGYVLFLDKTFQHVTAPPPAGWRSAKSNICIKSGKYYWEVKITKGIPKDSSNNLAGAPSQPHVRMGFFRREANLENPAGFDCYSYGFSDQKGRKVHRSRPMPCFKSDGTSSDICEGDVVGMEISLPSEQLHQKIVEGSYNPAVDIKDDFSTQAEAPNIVRDRVPIRIKSNVFHEFLDYVPTKDLMEYHRPGWADLGHDPPYPNHPLVSMRTLPGSYIKVYKNGVLQETAFTDLLSFLPPASKSSATVPTGIAGETLNDGGLGYYPGVSCYSGGSAEVNFGPDFAYPPPGYGDDNEDEVDMVGNDQPSSNTETVSLKAASDLFSDQVAEDIIYDIIDEVDMDIQKKGGQSTGRVAAVGGHASGGGQTVAWNYGGGDEDEG